MMKRSFLILCSLMILLSDLSFAEGLDTYQNRSINVAPLTLNSEQAHKLKALFPNKVTQDDLYNASIQEPSQHLVWQKIPLNVLLPLNQERIVSFPCPVDFGYDVSSLSQDILTVQNVNGTLYLVAKQAFDSERIFVRLKKTGDLVLLNLSANQGADSTPLSIVVPDLDNSTSIVTKTNAPGITQGCCPEPENKENLDYVELTRFAIQQLYAPKRLLEMPPYILRVPMHTHRTVELIPGDKVVAMPLISWRCGDLYVTAVELRNQLPRCLTLDPRSLRGHWKTIAFFPSTRLKPVGHIQDTTTVFVTSDQPFTSSLGAV